MPDSNVSLTNFIDVQNFLDLNGRESLIHDLKLTNDYLLGKKESEFYDQHKRDILGDIASFLNTQGGHLIYGISCTGDIVGIKSEENTDNLEERLSNKIAFFINSTKT